VSFNSVIHNGYYIVCLISKRIKTNFYLKNLAERKRNREILSEIRNAVENNKQTNKNPLISVYIPTYNRAKILTERTIPSVLRQTYQNFEIIVVGDHCTDNTEELLTNFCDNRIKFFNLEKRGNYPVDSSERWMVAGTLPTNKGIELCSGDWLAPLDDDDEFSEYHLQVLLEYALENNYEMVYGIVEMEMRPGEWKILGNYPPKCGGISRLSVLYHKSLKFLKSDINAWKYGEPGDWNLWRRMKEAGVRIGFLNEIVGKHYLEHTQKGV